MTYKIVERLLNRIKFKEIKIGGLIAEFYALRTIDKRNAEFPFLNLSVLLRNMFVLWKSNNSSFTYSKLIFTKLNNRFHCNALMDPLIQHYLNNGIVYCDEFSFNQKKMDNHSNISGVILFKQSNYNLRRDAFEILKTTLIVFFVLLKNRKRLNISISELIYFTNKMLEQLRKSSFWYNYFNEAVAKPRCVVTEFDRSSESAPLILTAKKYNIPTITLIHGVPEDYSFTPFLADYIFCWGESQKNQLISMSVDPKRIFMTGNPMFDFKRQDRYSADQPNKGLTICLAISPGFDNRLLIEPFALALNQTENMHGILKLHPSFVKDEFQWVQTISSRIEVMSSQDILNSELFHNIDLLIINDSGIANESLAAGVPVAVFVPEAGLQLNSFQNELIRVAGCRLATNELDLDKVFEEITTDSIRFRTDAMEKSIGYLKNLYETTGNDSVNSMISQIEIISGGKY